MKQTKRLCRWALLIAAALLSLGMVRAAAKEITSVSGHAAAEDVRVDVVADVAPTFQQHLDTVEWKLLVEFPGFSLNLSPASQEGDFPVEVADWVKSYRLEETPLGAQLVLLLGQRATPVDIRFVRQENSLAVVIPRGGAQKEERYILVPLGFLDPPLRFWEVSSGSSAYRVVPLELAVSPEEEAGILATATVLEMPAPQKRTVMSGVESFLYPRGIEKKPEAPAATAPTESTSARSFDVKEAPPSRDTIYTFDDFRIQARALAPPPEPPEQEQPAPPSWAVHHEVKGAATGYSVEDFAPQHRELELTLEPEPEVEPAPAPEPATPAPPAETLVREPVAETAAEVAEPAELEEPAGEPASLATAEPPPSAEILTPELLPEFEDKPVELVITKQGPEVEIREPEPAQAPQAPPRPQPPVPPPPTPREKPPYTWVPERERPQGNIPPPAPPDSWDVHLPPLLPPVPEMGIEYELLNRERITYEAVDTPLSQAISLMVASTSFNVIVDDVVGDMKVTLSFHDTPLGDALRSITAAKDIMYKLVNNTIIVGKREDVGRRLGGYVSRTFHLNYADAENVKTVLLENGLVAQTSISTYYGEPGALPIKTGEQELSEGQKGLTGASIKPMKKLGSTARRNVLVITETPERLDVISQVIEQIDRRPKQVTLETNIVEVSDEGLRDLGFHISETISDVISEEVPVDATGAAIEINPIPLGMWFQTLYRDPFTIELSLETVIQDGKARILARPNVPAVDGEQAIFFAGRLVPYISRPATTTGGTYTPPEVEYLPIGVILSFKPRIDDDNSITIEVNPSVSTLLEWMDLGQGAQAPISQTRQVVTTVRVRDGETFVIGGLLSEEDRERISKVPLLGDVPLFGKLFQRREVTKNRTEIMVFVTPRVYE